MSNNIKKLRKEAGLTQRELSEQSGIPFRTLQDLEDMRVKTLDAYKLHLIAKVLGCTIEDLINFDELAEEK